MIVGRSSATMLVMLGQVLLLADMLHGAQGLLKVPDYIFENDRRSVAGKRDGSDAGDSEWVKIPGWDTFSLHTATCSDETDESGSESDAMSMTKRDSGTVTDNTKAVFAEILDHMLQVNRGALDAISTLESAWDKMSKKEDLSAAENTQINFYMAMYGTFKKTDSTGMDRAKRRIAQLRQFANQYVEGLDNNGFHIRIICHDSGWEFVEYDDGDVLFEFYDGAEPYAFQRESNVQNSICENDKGEASTIAFMVHGRNGHDYMTICPLGWERFSEAIPVPVQKARSLSDLEYEHLDDVAKLPADGIFIHELTHAEYFWEDKAKDDESLDDGTKAYGFEPIVDLAKQGNSEDDASKLRAWRNADTYKYWAVGAYLSQCDWSTGTCIDPEDLMF